MRILRAQANIGWLLGFTAILLHGPAFADRTPHQWLSDMRASVQSASYEGTIIRTQNDTTEALKVVRSVTDGIVAEKIVAQEGNGLEIIRSGQEVHRIFPDRKSVLVEEWDKQSTLFSSLPSSDIRFGNAYDLALDRKERIAGREAILLAVRPHDNFRYGHRIWLDTETSFPLQTQLIHEGKVIEQVKFADITLNQEIRASALAPSVSTENFSWFTQSSAHRGTDVATTWTSDELPAGFTAVSTHEETMTGSGEIVTHILFSDGLASVSVFISPLSEHAVAGAGRMGSSNSYCSAHADFEITAVGEVPAMTVRQISTSMRPQ